MSGHQSPVTCHVLDSTLGKPGNNVPVILQKLDSETNSFQNLAEGSTDQDGRCPNLLPPSPRLETGFYKMVFKTGDYFASTKTESFYPVVEITFHLAKPEEHYHIPLLLSPWSYTTYRGN